MLPGEVKSVPLEVFQQGLVSHLAGMLWKEFLHRVRKGKILSHPQESNVLFVTARSRGKTCRDACEVFAFTKQEEGMEGSENNNANLQDPTLPLRRGLW